MSWKDTLIEVFGDILSRVTEDEETGEIVLTEESLISLLLKYGLTEYLEPQKGYELLSQDSDGNMLVRITENHSLKLNR